MRDVEVTLQSIADELELSTATVSRSLRQDRLINPETRARVNEAARRLGYTGRVRRQRRPVERDKSSNVLGLLVRHSSLQAAQYDSNLMKMMAGIMAVSDEHGMHVKVHAHSSKDRMAMAEDPSLIPSMVEEGSCQALIAHGDQDERDLRYLANRMSVVSMGRIYRDLPIDSAIADNVEGGHKLVDHLVDLGHRKLAWVGGYYSATFLDERQTGFMKGCLTRGIALNGQAYFGPEIYNKPDIQDTEALLAAVRSGVTAFVCGNDGIAQKVIRVLEDAGKRVPREVSVTGFDAALRTEDNRPLTSIDPSFFEIGKIAARLALQRVAHPVDKPCIVTVRGEMVIGATTAPPP